MLVGYEEQRRTLQRAVEEASAGQGCSMVVVGEAGSGKSTLFDHVAAACPDGATVLRTHGTELEAATPFMGLHDVVEPLRDRIVDLPEPQARALMAALALSRDPAGDLLAVSVAALNLLAADEDQPVVILVDDAMWLDPSSEAVLSFVAGRLEHLPVALLFSTRPAPERVTFSGLPAVRLEGLDVESAVRLLDQIAGPVVPGVARRLWEATAGSPLALIEVAPLLSPAALAGREPLPEHLPIGERLQAHFAGRLRALPERTQAALLLVAAGRSARWDVLTPALHAAGLDAVDLSAAEQAQLLDVTPDGVRFRHPLVRSAAYHRAPSHRRRQAHRLLADVAMTRDRDGHAWHLAAAATGADDTASQALQDAAQRALTRGAFAEAAAALQRAAQLSTRAELRITCQVDAARFWHAAGQPTRALGVLDDAAREAHTDSEFSLVEEVRGEIEVWLGRPSAARDRLAAVADRVESSLPEVAARLRVQASLPSLMMGEIARAEELAARGWEVLRRDSGVFGVLSAGAYAGALLLRGHHVRGVALVDQAAKALPNFPLERHLLPLGFLVLLQLAVAQRVDEAESLASRLVNYARTHGAPALMAAPLITLAELQGRRGDFQTALANATQAIEICRAVGHRTEEGHGLAILARTQAAMGNPEATATARQVLELAREAGTVALEPYAHHALGLLALGTGNMGTAIDHLEQVGRVERSHGVVNSYVVPWQPDAVEAYMREQRVEDAAAVTAVLQQHATASGTPWDRAVAARCRGLLGREDAVAALHESIAALTPADNPYEAARTSLVLGETLRRGRQRADARSHLRQALAAFERFDAGPWADRARDELRMAGGRVAGPRKPRGALTPQELRIAVRVAGGDTNHEVAAALYLSHKTVENRLTEIYAKLGVRSRTELGAVLQTGGDGAP
jgi:DNA-binding CsgD family transcriptional regulator/energy-coupling factor transporter ATP-binding protein EcfA2